MDSIDGSDRSDGFPEIIGVKNVVKVACNDLGFLAINN